LLDADAYFSSLVTMVQQLSVINGNTILPEMIIVGIPNLPGKRIHDLTPTFSTIDANSGGGESFISFVEKELQSAGKPIF
jgi:predicted alpha/beta superfamily hydrolase